MNRKRIAFALASLMLLGMLAACSGGKASPAVGTWEGKYTKFVGDPDSAKVTDEKFSLELKSGGKGTHFRNDLEISVTWELQGESFSMTETFMGMKIEYTGTLKDGKLNIFNGDPENDITCEYAYEKK